MARKLGLWAIGGSAVLALLLVLACHPAYALGAPAGMSAPPVHPAALESARAAQLLQSRSDWHAAPVEGVHGSLAFVLIGTAHRAGHSAAIREAHYGPLHRRPPPSFS